MNRLACVKKRAAGLAASTVLLLLAISTLAGCGSPGRPTASTSPSGSPAATTTTGGDSVAREPMAVDDAGTDGSAEALYRLGDPRLQVVRHAVRQGVSSARNTGLEHVDTPWVAFVDDDDLWSPDKLSAQLDALGQQPRAQWSCTGAVHIDSECRILGMAYPPADSDVADLLLRGNAIPGGGSGVTASRMRRRFHQWIPRRR